MPTELPASTMAELSASTTMPPSSATMPSKKASGSTDNTHDSHSTSTSTSDSTDSVSNGPQSPTTTHFRYDSGPATPPSIDPSIVAVHGSVPSSPKHKGLKEGGYGGYFHFPGPRGRQGSKMEDWGEMRAGVKRVETKIEEKVERATKNGRVVVIDFDHVCCQYNLEMNLERQPSQDADIALWVYSSCQWGLC